MSDWKDFARRSACDAGIDPRVFGALIQRESRWDPYAVAPDGAQGIAQIVPWAHPFVDPMQPDEALQYAANMLARLRVRYGGRYDLALAAYNGSSAESTRSAAPAASRAYVIDILTDALDGETSQWSCRNEDLSIGSQTVEPTQTPTPTYTYTPTPPPLLLTGILLAAILTRLR